MKKIVIDSDMRRKLLHFMTPLELCDEDGQVLARVTPSTPWNDPDNWKWAADLAKDLPEDGTVADEPAISTQELIDRIKEL
jgi:hypothetical protein